MKLLTLRLFELAPAEATAVAGVENRRDSQIRTGTVSSTGVKEVKEGAISEEARGGV